MNTLPTIRAATLVAALLFTGTASAGVVIKLKEESPHRDGSTDVLMYVDGPRVAMVMEGAKENGKQGTVFDSKGKVLWLYDTSEGTYTKLDEAALTRMKAQLTQMQEMMKQQMASAPPEQRAAMQKAMGKAMGGSGTKISYSKGARDKVGGYACTWYTREIDGETDAKLCIAPLKVVNVKSSDLKPFADMAKFFDMSGGNGAGMDFDDMRKAIGFEGFPVKTISLDEDGEPQGVSTLVSVERKNLPKSRFEVPNGLEEAPMEAGPFR